MKIVINELAQNMELPVHTIERENNVIFEGTHRIQPTKNANIRWSHTSFYINKMFYNQYQTKAVNFTMKGEIMHSDYSVPKGLFDMLDNTMKEQSRHIKSITKFNDTNLMEMAKIIQDLHYKAPYVSSEYHRKFYKYSIPIIIASTGMIMIYLAIKAGYRSIRWSYLELKYKLSNCTCCCKEEDNASEY